MTWFSRNRQNSSRFGFYWFYLFLLLAVVSSWIFAHDFVTTSLNSKSAHKQALMAEQSYALEWQFDRADDVVSLFGTQWNTNSNGFGFQGGNAEISLNLRGQGVIKSIHQDMILTLRSVAEDISDLVMYIEFSDPQSGSFFHSGAVAINAGENSLSMSELEWRVITRNDPDPKPTSWQSMQRLSTLVLRFSNPKEQQVILTSVIIPQQQKITAGAATIQLPCDQQLYNAVDTSISSFCFNSNYMTHLDRELSLSGQLKHLKFAPISTINPWLWLLLSLLGVLALTLLYTKPAKTSHIAAVVGLVYVTVFIVHAFELSQWEQLYRWPVMFAALILLWVYRQVFNTAILNAWPVWLITGLLSLVLVWMGGFSFEFTQLLPMYILWASLQQIILGPIATDYFQQNLNVNNLAVAILVAGLFALLHSPNHTLMMATFTGGFVWSYSWLKYKNIFVNIISHSLLALLFYQAISDEWLGSARIGVFF